MFDLVGKSVLITGASRGIGGSVSGCMAGAGADVILWRRDRNALAKTQVQVNALGVKSSVAAFDVTERASVMKVTADPIASQGKIEGAVVNAGINKLKSFLEWTPGEWDQLMGVNMVGAMHTLQAVGKHITGLLSGSFVTMSSIYIFVGAPGNSIYCLTKDGLMQLFQCLSFEWSRFNVLINAIFLGWIETDLTAPCMTDEKTTAAGLKNIPCAALKNPRASALGGLLDR